MPNDKRIYHPVRLWEEMEHNMWGTVEDKAGYLARALEFTGNAPLYGSFMQRVIREWHWSCENALTDVSMNRRAWLGHAACALAFRCPENIVRQAWGHLSNDQQRRANAEATKAIGDWESARAGSVVRADVGAQMLLGGVAG